MGRIASQASHRGPVDSHDGNLVIAKANAWLDAGVESDLPSGSPGNFHSEAGASEPRPTRAVGEHHVNLVAETGGLVQECKLAPSGDHVGDSSNLRLTPPQPWNGRFVVRRVTPVPLAFIT